MPTINLFAPALLHDASSPAEQGQFRGESLCIKRVPAPRHVGIWGIELSSMCADDDRGGEEAVQALWKAPDAQECSHESPEGTFPSPTQVSLAQLFDNNGACRIANTLTQETMLSPRLASRLRAPLVQQFQTRRSACTSFYELWLISCLYSGSSIPHASPPAQAGHPALATSTSGIVASSTSPIRESPLAPHSHRRTSSAERESKGDTDKPAATTEQTSSEPVVEHEDERDISAASS